MGNCIRESPQANCGANNKNSAKCSNSYKKASATSIEDRIAEDRREHRFRMRDTMAVH